MTPFRLNRLATSPGEFHALDLLAAAEPVVVVSEPSVDALVLGSTQSFDVADADACATAGVEVVRRRSGGGAVLVEVGAMTWFDVAIPSACDHAVGIADDVSASMRWLGRRVAAALDAIGVASTTVHEGPMITTAWSRLICYDGVGPGEVLVDQGGHPTKLVGVSQRRTRAGARFQCAVHHTWSPVAMLDLLRDPKPGVADLAPVATLPRDLTSRLPVALVDALNA